MIKIAEATLFVVATPIGNLGDITLRALEVLKGADVILAEDTRETGKLLASLNIRNTQKLMSCHNFNEEHRIVQVKELLNAGQSIARTQLDPCACSSSRSRRLIWISHRLALNFVLRIASVHFY